MVEKRRYPRFALGAEIRWNSTLGTESGIAPHVSHTRDLSAGGVCADLDTEVATGDTLLIEVKLSENQSIFSKGRVAWVNPRVQINGWAIDLYEAGIEFVNLSDAEKNSIDRFTSQAAD